MSDSRIFFYQNSTEMFPSVFSVQAQDWKHKTTGCELYNNYKIYYVYFVIYSLRFIVSCGSVYCSGCTTLFSIAFVSLKVTENHLQL